MFPDRLSKNLSSLLAGEARVAGVVEFAVLPSGDVRPGEIYKTLVKNRAKLTYDDVGAWLDGRANAKRGLGGGARATGNISEGRYSRAECNHIYKSSIAS
jgi:exoribonuclease-2